MSRPTAAPVGASAHAVATPRPPAPEILSTYLTPADPFPSILAELELVELLVLHSRITRQLDREYRTDPAGAHPVTLDRAQELVAELDTRQAFLNPTGSTPRAEPRVEASCAYRGAARAAGPAITPPPAPAPAPALVTGDRADTARTGPSTATTPHPVGKPGENPTRPRKETLNPQTLREPKTIVQDLGRLRPGERIEVWYRGQKQCVGTVDETAPSLGVVWIREALDGYRRMVPTQDTELRYHLPGPSRTGAEAGFRPGAASVTLPACDRREKTS